MKVLVSPKGLVLDANAIVPLDGAMRQASNCVVDQPGVARSRPSNDLHAAKSSTDYRPRAIQVFGGEIVAISSDAVDWRLEDEGGVISGNATPPTQAQIPRMEPARSSLYHTSTTGIQKHLAGGASTSPAGVEAFIGPVGGSDELGAVLIGGGPSIIEFAVYFDPTLINEGDVIEWYKTIGATSFVTYVVVRRTDANGYVRRSPPTRLYFNGTSVPSTDAFLWQTYTVTAADVTAGYFLTSRSDVSIPETEVFVPRTVNDDLLGEALYTNPGQQGALGAKYAPPSAAELVQFGGCMWYGNTASKHRVTVGISNIAGSTEVIHVDEENPSGLLGAINVAPVANVTTTSGTPTATGLSDDFEKFLRAGMYITDLGNDSPANAGTAFPADTTILSWVAGGGGTVTLTLSANATATGARDVLIGDVITISGRPFYAWSLGEIWTPSDIVGNGRRVFPIPAGNPLNDGALSAVAQYLAAAVNYEAIFDQTFRVRATLLGEPFVFGSGVVAPSDILLEEIGVGGSAFTVTSSNLVSFSPNLPLVSENDAEPARLWWSEPDEPEAVPLPNFLRVGNAASPILALTPLRSSLLVWKTDGLYRITGSSPDAWRLDVVDDHARLLTSGAVDVAEGFAYAWTADGVVRASETGVENVSVQIGEYIGDLGNTVLDDPTRVGSWLCCWRSSSIVLVGVQTSKPEDLGFGASVVLALSLVTGAWTTFWQRAGEEVLCADYDSTRARLYWSRGNAWEIRSLDRDCTGSDRRYSLTSPAVSGVTMVIADGNTGTWLPSEGDWISRSSGLGDPVYARIVGVSHGGGNYTITMETAPGDSGEGPSFEGIEGLPSTLEWQQSGPAAAWEVVREMQSHIDGEVMEGGPGTIYLAQGGTSSLSGAAVLSASPPLPTTYSRPYRYGVPRAVAKNAHFYPRVDINALGYAWRFHMLALIGDPVSDRVRR